MRDVLGDEFRASTVEKRPPRNAFICRSPQVAKSEILQRITDDYADIHRKSGWACKASLLPEDREKLALLRARKHADFAAILDRPTNCGAYSDGASH